MAGRLQALFLALVAVAVFLVGDAHPALAAATAPAVPAEPLPPAPAGSTALYDRYPLEAFTVDEGDYGSAVAARGAHNTINLLMVSRAWLVKLSARVAEQALTFRPAAALAGAARELTAEVSGLVWPQDSLPAPLVVGALATAGLWGLFLLLRGRSGAAWRTLISTSLVLVVAGATLAGLDRMLSTLDEFTHELSRLSFIAATRPLGTSPAITAPVQAAGDQAWRRLVLDPWVAAEFTDPGAADLYREGDTPGAAILKLPANQRRSHYLSLSFSEQQHRFAPWSESRLPLRMLTAGTSLVGAAGWALGVMLLAGGLLMYDLLILLLVVLTPLVVLLALWPGTGHRLAAGWGARLLSAALGKVTAGLLLGLFLTLSAGLFKLAESGGWPLAALFQWLLLAAVIRLRLYSPARIIAGTAGFWQTEVAAVRAGTRGTRANGVRSGTAQAEPGMSSVAAAPLRPLAAGTHPGTARPTAVGTGTEETRAVSTAGAQFAIERSQMQAALSAVGAKRTAEAPGAVAGGRGDRRSLDREGGQGAVVNTQALRPTNLVQLVSGSPETVSAQPETQRGAGRPGAAGRPAAGIERPATGAAQPRLTGGTQSYAEWPMGLQKP